MFSNIGFVIGNGESREGFNLSSLRDYGKIFGCNALYRDFKPDTLIAVDRKMLTKIRKDRYQGELLFPDRKRKKLVSSDGFHKFPFLNGDSGSTAIWTICYRYRKFIRFIFLIGFEFGWCEGEGVNNLYKGSECYEMEQYRTFIPDNWVRSFKRILYDWKGKDFYRVIKTEKETKSEFLKFPNYKEIYYEDLFSVLSTLKIKEVGSHEKMESNNCLYPQYLAL